MKAIVDLTETLLPPDGEPQESVEPSEEGDVSPARSAALGKQEKAGDAL
jgi:hypothetical protein